MSIFTYVVYNVNCSSRLSITDTYLKLTGSMQLLPMEMLLDFFSNFGIFPSPIIIAKDRFYAPQSQIIILIFAATNVLDATSNQDLKMIRLDRKMGQ